MVAFRRNILWPYNFSGGGGYLFALFNVCASHASLYISRMYAYTSIIMYVNAFDSQLLFGWSHTNKHYYTAFLCLYMACLFRMSPPPPPPLPLPPHTESCRITIL